MAQETEKTIDKSAEPGAVAKAIGGLAIFGALWFGSDLWADREMKNIEVEVADSAVQEYHIAKQQGDPIQTCVQAGLVSAAWLQVKNQSEYNKWKAVEKQDCSSAGMQFP